MLQLGLTACRENSVGMVKLQKLQKDIAAAKTERKVSVEKAPKSETVVKKDEKQTVEKENVVLKDVKGFVQPFSVVHHPRIPGILAKKR